MVIRCEDPCALLHDYPASDPYISAEWLDTMNVTWNDTYSGIGSCNSPSDLGDYMKAINFKLWTKNECLNNNSFEDYKTVEWFTATNPIRTIPSADICSGQYKDPFYCICSNPSCNPPYNVGFNWMTAPASNLVWNVYSCYSTGCAPSACWNGMIGGTGTISYSCDCEGGNGNGVYTTYTRHYRTLSTSFDVYVTP
jgi:hypothetical protein